MIKSAYSSETERMIADTAASVFADDSAPAATRSDEQRGVMAQALRKRIAHAGLMGACADEAAGGMGLGARDALPIFEAAGRNLAGYPLVHATVAAAFLPERLADVARSLVAGERTISVARSDGIEPVPLEAGRWRLSGSLGPVMWGGECDMILCDLRAAASGRRLVLVERGQAGVESVPCESADYLSPVSEVRLTDVIVESGRLHERSDDRAWQLLRILTLSEMLGAASAVFGKAIEYIGQRRQFGQVVGSFQALKHIAADDCLWLENMRVAVEHAAWAYDSDAADMLEAIDVAWFHGVRAARAVGQDAIQMHGGVGFTWEVGLHCYLRRILQLTALVGDVTESAEQVGEWVFGRQVS